MHIFEISSAVLILLVVISSIFALNPAGFVKTKVTTLETGYLATLASSSDDATFTFENYKDFNLEQTANTNYFKVSYKETKNEINGHYFGSGVDIRKSGNDLVVSKSKS